MAVISDIRNINDIHPKNKKEVGLRLGNLVLKNLYGFETLKVHMGQG
jgi:sialate O-acetylesterase